MAAGDDRAASGARSVPRAGGRAGGEWLATGGPGAGPHKA